MALRGPKVWLWRWRRNPLRRRTDAVEAWAVLGTWVLTVLAGVLGGLTATGSVADGLARERKEWRPVVARPAEKAPGAAPAHPGAASPEHVWGNVRWTAPDGSAHTGRVRVRPGSAAGSTVSVWTDAQGRLVAEPATVSQARLRASLIGTLVGVSAAMAPLACGRVLRGRLERRRMDQWDAEWARFGPLWGRKTS